MRALSRRHFGYIGAVLLGVGVVVLALVLYGVLQTRITNLIDANHANKATAATQLATGDARYKSLFDSYSQLSKEAAKAGVQTTTPNPSDVPQPTTHAITGAQGATGATGPEPTFEEVLAAVGDYCAELPQPPCQGPAGQNGLNGLDGKDGTNGVNGLDGQPPLSWTYSDALGISHTCNRTDPFDATAPTYSCT